MSTYIPDRWVIVKITDSNKKTKYKILAGWFSTVIDWKLSSGIVLCEPDYHEYDQLHYHQISGSVYIVGKDTYGFTNITQSVLALLIKDSYVNSYLVEVMPEDFEVTNDI